MSARFTQKVISFRSHLLALAPLCSGPCHRCPRTPRTKSPMSSPWHGSPSNAPSPRRSWSSSTPPAPASTAPSACGMWRSAPNASSANYASPQTTCSPPAWSTEVSTAPSPNPPGPRQASSSDGASPWSVSTTTPISSPGAVHPQRGTRRPHHAAHHGPGLTGS